MTWHEHPEAVLHFAPLTAEGINPKVWVSAALLGLALLGTGSLLLKSKESSVAGERTVSYGGSGLLTPHEIVALVSATILQHSNDDGLSKQISAALSREDRTGDFRDIQTSAKLANVITKRIREVSHDDRYQVLYSSNPPDLADAQGRSLYRITEHLSVALPSFEAHER
jgi:hypothetical protein